jgi:hypothetical protein
MWMVTASKSTLTLDHKRRHHPTRTDQVAMLKAAQSWEMFSPADGNTAVTDS